MPSIAFEEVPGSLRKPGQYIEIDWRGALKVLPSNRERCLIIAPMGEAGSSTPLELYNVFSDGELNALFGEGSPLARMTRAALKANKYINLAVCPLAKDETSLAEALSVIYAAGHTMIAAPFTDTENVIALRDYAREVSSAIEQRPVLVFLGQTGALVDAVSLAGSANDGRVNIAYLKGTETPAEELAAVYMATCAWEEDPARPLDTLELTGIKAPTSNNWLSREEQEMLLASGVTPIETLEDGRVRIVRAITSYTTNAQGVADATKLELTSIRSADYARKAIRTAISAGFPREKLSKYTIDAVWATIYDTLKKLEGLEIVENVDALSGDIILEKNAQEQGRLDAAIPTKLVPGLHIFAGKLNIILG